MTSKCAKASWDDAKRVSWQFWWLVQLSKKVFCWAFVSFLTWEGCGPTAYLRVTDLWCHCWLLSFNSYWHFWCSGFTLEAVDSALTPLHIWDVKGDQTQYVQSYIWLLLFDVLSKALFENFSKFTWENPKKLILWAIRDMFQGDSMLYTVQNPPLFDFFLLLFFAGTWASACLLRESTWTDCLVSNWMI